MVPPVRPAASLVLVACLCVSAPAAARDRDPWLGEDKALHFSASALAAGLGYGVSSLFVQPRWQRATISKQTCFSSTFGEVSASALGVPSIANRVCNLKP